MFIRFLKEVRYSLLVCDGNHAHVENQCCISLNIVLKKLSLLCSPSDLKFFDSFLTQMSIFGVTFNVQK